MIELFVMPKAKKVKSRRQTGRQVYKGIRFSAFHPLLGRTDIYSRSWNGLARQMGEMRERCRLGYGVSELVTFHVTEDEGKTWRSATPDEMLSFLNSQQ